MMVLVFTACLVSAPEDCRVREMTIFEDVGPLACMMGAQGELARWTETHPNWRIDRWRCEGQRPVQRAEAD